MVLENGTRLGPYEVLAPLGAGGMGEVYRARDIRLKRDVALKVLPALSAGDTLHRFEREAQAAAALDHPNIVSVHDVGTHGALPYVVMELLEGATLRERLGGGPLPVETAVSFGRALARALAAAHEKGIVHRDLKPENVFVTRDETPKVLDFGLARRDATGPVSETEQTASQITEPGTTLGTVGYMAPEQVRGLPAHAAADVFAFGAVLYEMLSGRRAFRGASAIETLHAILKEEPPPLSAIRRDVPPNLEAVVRRCLAKDPALRYASGRELASALDALAAAPLAPPRAGRPRVLAAAGLVVVALALLAAWRLARHPPAPAGRIASLAVLPLDNFSRDPEQEYFSDGMTEALIADLAQIRSLRVISRTSVMPYKKSGKALPRIARELNVDALVEGSVMRAGARVRITAQLVDGRSDRHLWARSYERDLKDALSLQSEVARSIAREIAAELTPEEETRLGPKPVDPDAEEAYLKGRSRLLKGTERDIRGAIVLFEQAIAKDRRAARPYAGLADAYCQLRSVYAPPSEVMPQARAAASKAIELDPALPEAHVSLANVHFFYEFDWTGAEKEYRRALELNPSSAEAHDAYANFLGALDRRAEASAEIARAIELDPLSPLIRADESWVRYMAREYPRAVEASLKAVELGPDFWWAHTTLGLAYEKTGRYTDAIAELETASRMDDNTAILEMLGGVYAASGRKKEARAVLDRLEERSRASYVCPYEIATVYAELGEKDPAIALLEKSKREHADCLPWAKADSKLDSLRRDPRFGALMKGIGLETKS
jgi:TolB-like protein/Flp pilus assembly protein TadD